MEKNTRHSNQDYSTSSSHTYEEKMEFARNKCVDGLFQSYLSVAEESDANVVYNKKSVAAEYPPQDGKGKLRPLFSLWLNNSDEQRGLWIGYSQTNEKVIGLHISQQHLPNSFERKEVVKGRNQWLFGFFDSDQAIRRLFSAVSPYI